ncbi:hypothetical protein XA68_14538 [Ophiocordyceps unilateralis]|uniref:Uncharacterized protein n=1 Tax=Ophiocordyceps unilateralis TaxID=268505 RepID=A0A2A9P9Y3_OPHUN|nr:hypothetical protein XA68_14538 [Ophiocordyceps unilateralis]
MRQRDARAQNDVKQFETCTVGAFLTTGLAPGPESHPTATSAPIELPLRQDAANRVARMLGYVNEAR